MARPVPSSRAHISMADTVDIEQHLSVHGDRLLAMARRILDDAEDARDVLQDAFLSALRNVATFEGRSLLSTWLYRVVANAALMSLRSSRRRLAAISAIEILGAPEEEAPDGPETVVERREMLAVLRGCIARLPASYRTIILLRDCQERSTMEAADALRISQNAAKIRLHRARRALRQLVLQSLVASSRGLRSNGPRHESGQSFHRSRSPHAGSDSSQESSPTTTSEERWDSSRGACGRGSRRAFPGEQACATPEELVRNRWAVVARHGELLELRWLPSTASMTDVGLMATLRLFAWEATRARPRGLLIDARDFRRRLDDRVMAWRNARIIPLYHAAGIRRRAILMPVGFGEPGREAIEGSAVFRTKHLINREAALEWLRAG